MIRGPGLLVLLLVGASLMSAVIATSYIENCHHPDAVNISAAVGTINSTQVVTVQWDSTIRPLYREYYCLGSRRYSVYVLTFGQEQLDDYVDNGPVMSVPSMLYINTNKPRETHYTLPPPVRRDLYYIFQIQNRRSTVYTGVSYLYKQFTSPIFYFGEQRSPYFLESDDITLTVSKGDTVTIQCPAGGAPPPHVLLIRDGRVLGTITETGYQITVSVSDVGDYYCSASSIHVNPPHLKRRLTVNKKVTIKLAVSLEPNPNQSSCQTYNSRMCRNYIHEDTNVLVNNETEVLESTIRKQIGLINTYTATHYANLTYVATGITEETIDQCSDFIRGIACNSVYPYCDASSTNSHPVPRPLCKHTCDILRAEGFCSFFLDQSFLEEYRYQLSPLRDALFASCDNRTTPGGESPECIYVSLDSPVVDSLGEDVVEQLECVKGNGRSYAGHLSRTISGLPCQSWYSQSPNAHSIVPAHFQLELYGANFSCRNPGGLGERPWCYTARGSGRWEYCNPPHCHTCEMYGGQFCSSLSGYRERSVYVNREGWSSVSLGDIEGSMVGLYHSLGGNGLSPACQNALTLLICHGSLPFCKEGGSPSPLSSCVDHCTLVDEIRLACPVKVLSELTSRWNSTHRVTQLLGPDCSLLSGQHCMPSPTTITTTQAVSNCYNSRDYGQSYGGPHSHTVSNLPCMDWSETNTSFTATLYPELVGAGSTCRNPGQWAKALWCFNNQGLVEPCLVESCSTVGEGTTAESVDTEVLIQSSAMPTLSTALGGAIGTLVLSILLV
ncbi:uncharacterized protein LOC135337305 [Halichondria panicea]|uniref:uncharacterized protein LOC135337305 n=1 Tax=Halichondria panicea TaxID=6063 RepID=UPI00312B4CB7